jgi:uncharacterized Ntn-hydrolase superfamily protein
VYKRQEQTGELGIAVQSKFLAVGAVVPWAKANVGAIATQSYANTAFGPEGMKLLEEGKTAEEALQILIEKDEDRSLRQVGIVDVKGNTATYTGDQCYGWAGGITGKGYAAQGNILVSKETVDAMANTFEQTKGNLAEKLLMALEAGGKAGGDSRGEQSAALYVVKENGGYGGYNDRYIDLRVDDHQKPIQELIRIYHLHKLYFFKAEPDNIIDIDIEIRKEMTSILHHLGYDIQSEQTASDEEFYKAFHAYIHRENFEERDQPQGKIDLEVLNYMRAQIKV